MTEEIPEKLTDLRVPTRRDAALVQRYIVARNDPRRSVVHPPPEIGALETHEVVSGGDIFYFHKLSDSWWLGYAVLNGEWAQPRGYRVTDDGMPVTDSRLVTLLDQIK